MILPFGKHRGKNICNVPRDYLRYVLTFSDLDPNLRKAIEQLEDHWNSLSKTPLSSPELKPVKSPKVVKPTKAEKRAEAEKLFAEFVVPAPNTQVQSFIVDRRNYEKGDDEDCPF